MIMMMGILPIQLKPLITPFLSSMADDIGPLLSQMFDMKSIMSVRSKWVVSRVTSCRE